MTVLGQTELKPIDYPPFSQTVGNSFASSVPDRDWKENSDLNRLSNVADGLYKIYEQVQNNAAANSPMTVQDSAIVATTVTTMTEAVGVESAVTALVSLESRGSQHIGHIITLESITETIKNTIIKMIETISKYVQRFIGWVKEKADSLYRKRQAFLRAINTISRVSKGFRIEYTPAMAGLLVDGQIPANPDEPMAATFGAIGDVLDNSHRVVEYARGLAKAISKGSTADKLDEDIDAITAKAPKISFRKTQTDGTVRDSGRTVAYSKPLANNAICIALNIVGKEPIDRVNYGCAIIPTTMAKEYGIKENYAIEPAEDSFFSFDYFNITALQRVESSASNAQRGLQGINKEIEEVEKILSDNMVNFRKLSSDADTETDDGQLLVQYIGVVRALLTGAIASLQSAFTTTSNVLDSFSALVQALNKKVGAM